MNAKKGAPEPTPIASLDDFNNYLNDVSQNKLVVIDMHQKWCGPAAAIQPFWNSQWIELDQAKDRLALCSLCLDDNPDVLKVVQKDCEVKLNTTCKPVFILMRLGHIVGTIDGLNTGVLSMLLDLHLPKLPKKAA